MGTFPAAVGTGAVGGSRAARDAAAFLPRHGRLRRDVRGVAKG